MSAIFDRVVCVVDPSVAGLGAAVVAARLTWPGGSLALVSVDDASRCAGTRLGSLLAEIDQREATLVIIAGDGVSRTVGIALGAVSTHLVHEARCPVLVLRAPHGVERWPRSLVVGVDGSPESEAAVAVSRELSDRFGAELRVVAATGDPHVDLDAARRIAPELEELPGRAVDELHLLSELADLVVVGSRSLTGVRALSSVSERVAHEARCAVLVMRGKAERRTDSSAAMRSSPHGRAGRVRMRGETQRATLPP